MMIEDIEVIEARISRFQRMLPADWHQSERERFWIGFALGGQLVINSEEAIEDAVRGAIGYVEGSGIQA